MYLYIQPAHTILCYDRWALPVYDHHRLPLLTLNSHIITRGIRRRQWCVYMRSSWVVCFIIIWVKDGWVERYCLRSQVYPSFSLSHTHTHTHTQTHTRVRSRTHNRNSSNLCLSHTFNNNSNNARASQPSMPVVNNIIWKTL
jgi:hypothetical protein